jgi:hypothetical protein
MSSTTPKITMTEVTDPVEIGQANAQREKFERNLSWLQTHADEVYSHRGKHICVAGQELFVGDNILDVLAKAKAVHPDDDGPYFQYVPKERLARIYGNLRSVDSQ